MNTKYTGSCLCGTVHYEIEGDFQRFYLCHCSHCRKGSGSAHAANLFSFNANVNWLSGEDKTHIFQLPDSRHARCFCSVCGSALPYQPKNGAFTVVPAGSLDTPLSTTPTAHIFMASKADWDDALETYPMMDGMPEG